MLASPPTLFFDDYLVGADANKGCRIKAVLAEKDIQQKELAKKVGKAPNTITRICNNESQPTLRLLYDIAKALDVDIRELLVATK